MVNVVDKIKTQFYDDRKTNEMHFQSKPYIYNINHAPTCFGAAEAQSSGSPKNPDEIVRMLRHKCRISEGREWILSVCCQPADNTQTKHVEAFNS
jgi:hypothetical protein